MMAGLLLLPLSCGLSCPGRTQIDVPGHKGSGYVTLSNGVKMPILGYGLYQVTREDSAKEKEN